MSDGEVRRRRIEPTVFEQPSSNWRNLESRITFGLPASYRFSLGLLDQFHDCDADWHCSQRGDVGLS
jgi:hypothetical protein